MTITDEQLSTALDEIHICDPDAAALCEDVLERLERHGDEAAVDEWIAMIVKGSAGPRATAAIKVQAREKLAQTAQISARPQRQERRPERPVRSQERAPARDDTPIVSEGITRRVMGIAALMFGLPLWVVGAHYTLDGWTLIVNSITALVRYDLALPMASGQYAALLIPVGIIYSIGERHYVPWRKVSGRWIFIGWGIVMLWAVINGSDLISTYMGIDNPPDDAWPITVWMNTTLWAKLTWSFVVTYIPETLLLLGWRWLFR